MVDNAVVNAVSVSCAMAETWAESTLVDYGADACIRCTHADDLPMIKIALPDKTARLRLRYEFDITRQLADGSLPVAKVGTDPLIDGDGMYGYRLEALRKITACELNRYSEKTRAAISYFHTEGFSHGDLSPSNVMRNYKDDVVLIDCGFSGLIGTEIPDHIPQWVYEGNVFQPKADEIKLLKFFSVEQAPV